MPVLVNYSRCTFKTVCFAANVCPKDTLRVDPLLNKVVVDPTVCGDCPGPCLNFCDPVALKYAPDLEELDIMQRELDGLLTAEAARAERQSLAERRKAAEQAEQAEKELAANAPLKLTAANFVQEVARSELPVLVDFWAEWCGPCKQIGPVVDQLAVEFAGRMKFGKVNIDEEQAIAGQLNIQSIPTLMIFWGGQVADVIVGAVGKEQLRARLQRVVEAVGRAVKADAAGGQAAEGMPAPAARPAPVLRPTFGRPNGNPRRPGL